MAKKRATNTTNVESSNSRIATPWPAAVMTEFAVEFATRGKAWTRVAHVLFYSSMVCVGFGLVIFLFADRILIPDSSRLQLEEDELKKLKEMKIDKEKVDALAGVAVREAKSFKELVDELCMNIRLICGEIHQPDATIATTTAALKRSMPTSAIRALLRGEESELVQKKFVALCRDESVSYEALLALVDELEREAASPTNVERLQGLAWKPGGDYFVALSRIESSANGFVQSANELFESIDAVELVYLEEQISLKQQEVDRLRREFDPNNLQSTIPLLVVRVGAVVLLIFLTQILLAGYRYTTMLATHFEAASDSLRLMASKGDKTTLDEFEVLFGNLSPNHVTFAPPEAPTNSLVSLFASKK